MTTLTTRTSSRVTPELLPDQSVEELPAATHERHAERSSSAPGPSPMKSRSASGSPRPNTTWVRPTASAAARARARFLGDELQRGGHGGRLGAAAAPAAGRARRGTACSTTTAASWRTTARFGVDGAGRGDDEGVAVAGGVGRVEGARQAVVARLGGVEARRPCRAGVGGDDPDGRVLGERLLGRDAGRRTSPSTRRSPTAFTASRAATTRPSCAGDGPAEPARAGLVPAPPLGRPCSRRRRRSGRARRRRRWRRRRRRWPCSAPGRTAPVGLDEVEQGEADDDRHGAGRRSGSRPRGPRTTP